MNRIGNRLRDLERGSSAMFVLSGPEGFDVEAVLAGEGVRPGPADLVVAINKPAPADARLIRRC